MNINAEYHESMSIRNPPLTYFPSLVQGVPTELKRNKQKEKQRTKHKRSSKRANSSGEKKTLTPMDPNRKVRLNLHKSQAKRNKYIPVPFKQKGQIKSSRMSTKQSNTHK